MHTCSLCPNVTHFGLWMKLFELIMGVNARSAPYLQSAVSERAL
jgi:hypothetical protein